MEKAVITSCKSHMSRGGPRAARPWRAVNARRAPIPVAREVGLSECDVSAVLRGVVAACIVDTSARPVTGGRHAGRGDDGGSNGQPGAGRPARRCVPRGRPPARAKGAEFRSRSRERGAVQFGRGQGEYFTADGSGFRGKPGFRDYHGARARQTRRTCKWLQYVTSRVHRVKYFNL
jgi:hypothetical protein